MAQLLPLNISSYIIIIRLPSIIIMVIEVTFLNALPYHMRTWQSQSNTAAGLTTVGSEMTIIFFKSRMWAPSLPASATVTV